MHRSGCRPCLLRQRPAKNASGRAEQKGEWIGNYVFSFQALAVVLSILIPFRARRCRARAAQCEWPGLQARDGGTRQPNETARRRQAEACSAQKMQAVFQF
jgi:hypothetical protein